MSVDPDTGDDVVPDTPPDSPSGASEETDPHLLLYSRLHEEIQARTANHHQSLITGLSVIGLVIAYGLLTGELVFMAVIPVILGVLTVQSIRHFNNILLAAHHLSRIEDEYADEYPLFIWEKKYGLTGTNRNIKQGRINWADVPSAILWAITVCGYFGFMYVGFIVWPPDGIDIIAVGLTRTGLVIIYVLLTTVLCIVSYSHYLHRTVLVPDQ